MPESKDLEANFERLDVLTELLQQGSVVEVRGMLDAGIAGLDWIEANGSDVVDLPVQDLIVIHGFNIDGRILTAVGTIFLQQGKHR